MNRKAFTMIELLFVIVIMGIVGGLALEAIRQYYEGVYRTQTIAKRVAEADHILDLMAKRFENTIDQSITLFDKDDDTMAGNCISEFPNDDASDYTVVMLSIDRDSQNTQYYSNNTGWSEKIRVDDTNSSIVYSNDANYTFADSVIKQKYFNQSGRGLVGSALYNSKGIVDTCRDFYGADLGAYFEITDMLDSNKKLGIHNYSLKDLHFPDMDVARKSAYVIDTALAFRVMDDGRLLMFSNFRPWKGELYKNGKQTLLGTDVASIFVSFDKKNTRFNLETGTSWKLKVCMRGLDENLSTTDESAIAICRERSVNVRY